MFMLLRFPFKDTVSVWKATLSDSHVNRFWPLCLCSANTSKDALDCSSWTLVSAKEVFDSNEEPGKASVSMLSAAQE